MKTLLDDIGRDFRKSLEDGTVRSSLIWMLLFASFCLYLIFGMEYIQ